jgi:outer membrane usher protein
VPDPLHRRTNLSARAARWLAAALWLALPPAPAQDAAAPARIETLVYEVQVNGRPSGDAVLLRLDGARLLASQADWDRWHLARPDTGFEYQGQVYYELGRAAGFTITVDEARQQASLGFGAEAFAPSVLRAAPDRRVAPQPPPGLGAFLNYEFFGTHRAADTLPASSNLDGVAEVGAFNTLGVLTSQWLGRNLTAEDDAFQATPGAARGIRLETALTRDLPDSMQTLRLGDGVGAAGLWGRPVRYGGLRWHRNFSTQPGFVTLPRPALRGETALPSVLDIYVDGMRRQSLDVPPGPFVVEDLPVISGQGEVQVVVRDLLGREQVVSESYLTGAQLLRAGLHDYSYEAGFVREQFGVLSDEYGDPFVAGTHRYGFDDAFTGEARVEAGKDSITAGLGGALALPGIALVSNAFALSHSDAGDGALDVLTVQHSSRRGLSLGARLQAASRHFTQAGLAPGASVPRRSFSANLGYGIRPLGRLGLAYVNRDDVGLLQDFEAVTASYHVTVRRLSLSLYLIDRKRPQQEYAGGVTLGLPFGRRDTGSTGYRHRETDAGGWASQGYARLQRNLPQQEGWGYRVLVGQDQGDTLDAVTRGEAGVGLNARYGSYGLEAASYDDVETYRATVSGGLGTLGGHAFASRKLTRSFAVVEAGAPDIDLLLNNQVSARTGADGVAVLPYLQPYQDNRVVIDATNVPLDVEVRSGEFRAVPYYRSGVLVPLDARRTRSALLVRRLPNGSPLPAGATGRLGPAGEASPVAKGGKLFLVGLAAKDNAVDVRWNHSRCVVTFDFPAGDPVQPQIGPLACTPAPL